MGSVMEIENLHRLVRLLQKFRKDGILDNAAVEVVLKPVASMNEKLQEEYAGEMLSVLKTSSDKEEILSRQGMVLQMLYADRPYMEYGQGTVQDDELEGDLEPGAEQEAGRKSEPKGCSAGLNLYLTNFLIPDAAREERILQEQGMENGGQFAYVDNPYPCGIFPRKKLMQIDFSTVTIFYGGNGSGKSTLLNLIANKLQLKRIAPYNTGETFARYTEACQAFLGSDEEGDPLRIPNGSRIITSDDVFDYMLTMRTNNDEISENRTAAKEEYMRLKFTPGMVKVNSMDDMEELRMQVQARGKTQSRRQFINRFAGAEMAGNSNGETALLYFQSKFRDRTLYCLDEPENSLSPRLQLELVKILEQKAYAEECQFIIATHSPFLLAMRGARVYDLDAFPAAVRNWWELENTRLYFEFFEAHREFFMRATEKRSEES